MGALLAALSACSAREVETFRVPEGDRYALFVTLAYDGSLLRASPVFGVESGHLSFGTAPKIALDDGERAALVSFSASALAALHPGFTPAREGELRAELITPADAPEIVDLVDRRLVRTALPANATIAMGSGPASEAIERAVRRGLALVLPVDPEHCRSPAGTELVPFGDVVELLPYTAEIPGERAYPSPWDWRRVVDAVVLDRDRVVIATRLLLAVVERGRPIALPPADADIRTFAGALPILRAGGRRVNAVALDRTRHPEPGADLLVAAGFDETGALAIWELAVSDAGLRFVGTATITGAFQGEGRDPQDLVVDADGTAFVVGGGSLLLTRTATEAVFRVRPPLDVPMASNYRRAAESHDPEHPHVITEDFGQILLGDVVRGGWTSYLREDRFSDRRLYGVSVARDGSDLWAVGTKGSVLRITPRSGFEPVDVFLPPSLRRCGSAAEPGVVPILSRTLRDVVVSDDAAYLVLDECDAVLRVRRSDLCTSGLGLQGLEMGASEEQWHASEGEDVMVLFGDAGKLYTFDLAADRRR